MFPRMNISCAVRNSTIRKIRRKIKSCMCFLNLLNRVRNLNNYNLVYIRFELIFVDVSQPFQRRSLKVKILGAVPMRRNQIVYIKKLRRATLATAFTST